mgnify:CR=1 FL=1
MKRTALPNGWHMVDDRDVGGEATFVPPDLLELTPVWRNMFENTACVQFDHRMLAYATALSGTGLFALARSGAWHALPIATRRFVTMGALAVVGQASLGVATLLYVVPIELAAAHQAGSLVLLTTMLGASHALSTAAGGADAAGRRLDSMEVSKGPSGRENLVV